MKFRYIQFLSFALLFSSHLFAQIGPIQLPKIKNLDVVDKLERVKDNFVNKLNNTRKEYDTTSFNYAVALSDNAGLFESEERYKRNQKILIEAINTADSRASTPVEDACSMNEVGEMMYAGNHFKAAESSFKKALSLFEQENAKQHPVYSLTLSNLGLLYHTTGRYALSEKYSLQALELRKTVLGAKHAAVGASTNNIAVLYKDLGRFNESESLIEEAITIIKNTSGEKSSTYALALNNKAMILQALGRYNIAEPLLNQAIDIAGDALGEKSVNYVRLMTNLAMMYQDMKDYPKAESIYLKAIKIKERRFGTSHPDYAHLLNNLAALYMLIPKYSEVEDLLKRSANIYKKQFGEQHPSYASAISNLGNYYRITDQLTLAEPLLKQALEIRKSTLGVSHPDYLNSQESLGLLYWQTNQLSEASLLFKTVLDKNIEQIDKYFASMSEAEKSKLWDKMKVKFQRFNSFVIVASKTNPSITGDLYNYQLTTKAILLNSSNKVKERILNSGKKELINEYQEWLDEKENLARLYSMSKSELAEEKINIDSIEQACNKKEKSLSSKSNVFSQGFDNSSIKFTDIQNNLTVNEAAIEIIQFNKFNKAYTDTIQYLVLVLTKDNPLPKIVLMENGKLLEKKYYNFYKNSIKFKLKDELTYEQFYSKIEKEVSTKSTLYFSLDGIFNQINFNTIQTPTGFLIDKKSIRIVTNTKDIIDLKQEKVHPLLTAALCGFPAYGNAGTLTSLPGTKTEIESIKTILTASRCNSKMYLQAEATEANIKSLNSPNILHIATHGFFLPESDDAIDEKVFGIESGKSKENPLLRSGLMLANAEQAMEGKSENGILFAFEAMNLSLDNTEIVVMSACETGLGDVKNGEGVYGLQRAFQVAGAKSIIMSLWKVNDDAAHLLMTSFYKYFALTGNKHTSFKKAQQELKLKFKDPYYWGAFVLIE